MSPRHNILNTRLHRRAQLSLPTSQAIANETLLGGGFIPQLLKIYHQNLPPPPLVLLHRVCIVYVSDYH